MIPGRRLTDGFSNQADFTWDQVKPGDYFLMAPGRWFLCAPSGEHGQATNVVWTIEEHEDGTITISPSLHFNKSQNGWHGYLQRGQWRSV